MQTYIDFQHFTLNSFYLCNLHPAVADKFVRFFSSNFFFFTLWRSLLFFGHPFTTAVLRIRVSLIVSPSASSASWKWPRGSFQLPVKWLFIVAAATDVVWEAVAGTGWCNKGSQESLCELVLICTSRSPDLRLHKNNRWWVFTHIVLPVNEYRHFSLKDHEVFLFKLAGLANVSLVSRVFESI